MSHPASIPGSVAANLLEPINQLLPQCHLLRPCPALPDETWIHPGLTRVLFEHPSGRAFLQENAFSFPHCPPLANYFESLKSTRRLKLLVELNGLLRQDIARTLPDALGAYPELADFDLYAGDGHWHGAAAHDAPQDGKKYAVGHFYALDLRRHTLSHLALGQDKHEHDVHVLKRLGAEILRQGAPKGRKVLYAWDKAVIDFRAWHAWKQSHGIYCLSMEKENMKLEVMGQPEWDRNDPVNAGIQSVELVAGQAGVLLRRIAYIEPITGTEYRFITNEMKLRPGLVAFLYKLRWDVEKVFDQLKNKLNEKKAWASSREAKWAQANLICLLHNLLQIVEEKLRLQGIKNQAELARKTKVLAKAQAAALAAGRTLPACVTALQRLTQTSVKLLRWLRSGFKERLAWDAATPRLRVLYALLEPRFSDTVQLQCLSPSISGNGVEELGSQDSVKSPEAR